MSAEVVIKGFKNAEEAEQFCLWYSGQGEQDAAIWFECRQAEGEMESSFIGCGSITILDSNTVEMTVTNHK